MAITGTAGNSLVPAQNYVSVSRRALDVEDYIDMARRHRTWIVGPTFAGLVISVVVAFLLPDTFASKATLRIQPPTVPEQVVPSTPSIPIAQRLEGLRTQILSRSSLTAVITDPKLNLYPKLRSSATLEDAIDKMQKDVKIGIESMGDDTGRRMPMVFQVSFSYPDKYKAQAVVQQLVALVTTQNVTMQSESAKGTQTFVSDELKAAEEAMNNLSSDVAKFKLANAGSVGESAAANGQRMSALQSRMAAEDAQLGRLQETQNMLQTQLQTQQDAQNFFSQISDPTTPALALKDQTLASLDQAISQGEAILAELRQRYQEIWPEVKAAKARLEALRAQRDAEQAKEDEAAASQPAVSPKKGLDMRQQAVLKQHDAAIKFTQTQMTNLELEVRQANAEKADLQKEINALQARIDAAPEVEQKYADLTRNLGLATVRYNDLKTREEMTQTARNLEDKGYGEQLQVLDPANLPQTPSDPNRWEITGCGIALGLMAGLVMAGAKETKDTSLKNLKDVRAYTNLPVLSSIPLLENALLVRRKRRLAWLGWSSAVLMGTLAMAAAMYYYFMPHGA
ncbi:MAG: hypothetical protein ABSC23_04855 [Bryobacteraceae bacterium]|jgi:polysaccharide chain length determinant protein (PEP-CTERM system associated)